MKKAHAILLGLAVCLCSACAAPSLRYKSDVNQYLRSGQFEQADSLVVAKKGKLYTRKDSVLFYLDHATLLHDAQQPRESDSFLRQAQERIDELFTKSVSASMGRLFINDLTTPYYAADYEHALTFFYRALNFIQLGNTEDAAVEARKAVMFLDELRGSRTKGYTDDPFVQYFSSLIFESAGERDDARISRENALRAYEKAGMRAPDFPVPAGAGELGEVIILHYNGLIPLKKSQTVQVSWNDLVAAVRAPQERRTEALPPQAENAIRAGFMGNAVTLSFPELETQVYSVAGSSAQVNGQTVPLQKVADLSRLARQDLEEKKPALFFRMAARAILKQTAAVQARHLAANKNGDAAGELAGRLLTILGAALEQADTRQWFTLPAEIYMTRLFLPPGTQNIKLLFSDGNGKIITDYTFENVTVKKGGRVFLHHRTAF